MTHIIHNILSMTVECLIRINQGVVFARAKGLGRAFVFSRQSFLAWTFTPHRAAEEMRRCSYIDTLAERLLKRDYL